ncbi:putative P450 monooxygenase [Myriangium duriaei CBS 260.36]|uniref:P450 monooxygenase n=1 Tax=Myriangium duriaei CBS 260.36 TaxID=1168546 RepID=A0A9P4J5K3_9PEZI|nr:putative P450 monooxygenase [Myriangium duriaei CBS 260.36]
MALGISLILIGFIQIFHQICLERNVKSKKIESLGGLAPRVNANWIFFGSDFLWSSVQHAIRQDDFSFWSSNFRRWGAPQRPWTFETKFFSTRMVFTADEDNIKAILSTQFEDFGKGEDFRRGFHDFLGDSVFTTDGHQWKAYRKLLRPHFSKYRVSDLDILERHVQVFLPLLSAPETVDVKDLFLRLSLDTFTDSFLDNSAASLITPDNDLARAFNDVQRIQYLMSRAGPLRVFLHKGRFHEGLRKLDKLVQPAIQRALTLGKTEQAETDNNKESTFLEGLSGISDEKAIRNQVLSLLMAGRDTTAYALSWMFYHLGQQPDIVERLQQEIISNVGPRKPTYQELKTLSLLQNTIKETLRLYPALPFNVRVSTKDTSLPRGGGHDGLSPIGVLRNTPISFSTLLLHRKPDSYSLTSTDFPNPKDFAPDRWCSWSPDKWTYMPFSVGPRTCIGQDFAMTHMAYVAVRILQTYKTIECPMEEGPGEKCELLLMPSKEVQLAFRTYFTGHNKV